MSDFITDCDSSTQSATACNSFQSDTANAACVTCIFDINDAGAAGEGGAFLINAAGNAFIGSNYPGCIALEDTTNGVACATDLEPLVQCQSFACGTCTTQTDYDNCITAVNAGACMSYLTPVQTACATDFADGGVLDTKCDTDQEVLNVICGTGP
jgi:hypothetical protein